MLISACAIGGDEGTSVRQSLGGTASINLSNASARATLTSDSQWTLTKTGSVSGSTVTWNISATKTATVSGQLVLQGQMTVTNSGSGPATIGNIVVNLQKRVSNKWVSASADVADATSGDAATTANIFKQASSENLSSFTENSASGSLEFMDATNNTVFSLVPEATIPAGGTKSLLFQATFDNNVLGLAPGTSIRSEVIVSFGNATATGNSAPNIDINGNGIIDSDEARVRSVPSRLTLTVPPQDNTNTTPTLSDTLNDIVGVGVTVSNVQFNLGATGGSVTATVSGSGSVTNCAHLTSDDVWVTSGGFTFLQSAGLDLEACDTEDVGSTACTPGTQGCAWNSGALTTYDQSNSGWGDGATIAGTLLLNNFQSFYGASGVTIGSGIIANFDSATAVFNYLPQVGTVGTLTSNLANPTDSSAGAFGGDVLALTLNVRFSDGGVLPYTSATAFGDLYVCGYATVSNQTVRQFLANANTVLGGGSVSGLTPDLADQLAVSLNASFSGGTPSTFAQTYLVNGTCP
jgi:hypothetical protein